MEWCHIRSFLDLLSPVQVPASTAMFNHVGDGVIMTHHSEHTIRVMDYPSLTLRESPAAHVGGCVAVALDPRGRYGFTFSKPLTTFPKNWYLQVLGLWWIRLYC